MKYFIIILFLFSTAKAQVGGLLNTRNLNNSLSTGVQWLTSAGTNGAAVLEITHLRDSGKIKFLYTTSDSTGINSLSVAAIDSMTGTITKYGKVIGVGLAGNRQANTSEWFKVVDTIYCYAASNYNSTNLYLYTSTNGGFAFTDQGAMLNISIIQGATYWGNTGLLKDTAGVPVQINGKYQLFIEASNTAHAIYELHLLESASLRGGWTYVRKLGGALQGISIGTSSGPRPIYLDGVCHLFYHYSPVLSIPTYLAYATSMDLAIWFKREIPYKKFESLPYGVSTDQIADPDVFQFQGKTYHLAEYTFNTTPYKSVIYKWTYNGTLKQLLFGLAPCIGCAGVYP